MKLTSFEATTVNSNMHGEFVTMSTMFVEQEGLESIQNFRETSRRALRLLQRRHPYLRSHLEFTSDDPLEIYILVGDPDDNEFEKKLQIEYIDLTQEKEKIPNREDLHEMCAEFNTRLFDLKKPDELLWRVQFISFKNTGFLLYLII